MRIGVDTPLTLFTGDELGIKALTINGKDRFIAGRVLASEHPPDAHIDVARSWLAECERSHPGCRGDTTGSPQLPTRVIDVGRDGQTPRLVDGLGRLARYATLSHCWGRLPTIKTELESVRSRQIGIPLETLPKTFKDATMMCRKLDIQYLWIDSLCIIQDDKRDWEYHSSGKETSIYARYID